MSKIIQFPGMGESLIEEKICAIKKSLEKPTVTPKKLLLIEQELIELNGSLLSKLQEQKELTERMFSSFLTQAVEIGALTCVCHELAIDKQVDAITNKAQELASSTPCHYQKVSRRVAYLEKTIKELTYKEALSLENRQMIHLARYCLKHLGSLQERRDVKAIRLDFKAENAKKDLNESYDLSIALYEIAGELYHNQFVSALALFKALPEDVQEILKDLMLQHDCDFNSLSSLTSIAELKKGSYKAIEVFIGYTNKILYNLFEYPTKEEVEDLFKDLDEMVN